MFEIVAVVLHCLGMVTFVCWMSESRRGKDLPMSAVPLAAIWPVLALVALVGGTLRYLRGES